MQTWVRRDKTSWRPCQTQQPRGRFIPLQPNVERFERRLPPRSVHRKAELLGAFAHLRLREDRLGLWHQRLSGGGPRNLRACAGTAMRCQVAGSCISKSATPTCQMPNAKRERIILNTYMLLKHWRPLIHHWC